MAYTKYSLTPANNNASPPDGAPEGMLPSAVNDTMRDMMAQIRDCGDGIRGGTYTMTAPVITGGSINGAAIGASSASTGAFTTLSATGVSTFSAGSVSAPAIITSGDTNTGVWFPAADTIAASTGGSERFRIDSSGNFGIGSNNPLQKLHVATASSTYIQVQNTGNSVSAYYGVDTAGGWIGTSTNHYAAFYTNNSEKMRITSGGFVGIGNNNPTYPFDVSYSLNGTSITRMLNSSSGGSASAVFLADNGTNTAQYGVAGASYSGYGAVTAGNAWIYSANSITLMVDNGSGVIKFTTGGNAETMRLNATGNLVLKGGTAAASGVGVTFPSTQAASSDANCLDDYEEGTWTPAIGGTTTYVSADCYGSYVKVGRVVTVTYSLSITTVGGGYSVYGITNLPFTSTASRTQYGLVGNHSNVISSTYSITSYTDPGTTNCNYLGKTSLSTGSVAPLTVMQNGTYITGTFSYITA